VTRRKGTALAVLAALLAGTALGTPPPARTAPPGARMVAWRGRTAPAVPGEILLKFRSHASPAACEARARAAGLEDREALPLAGIRLMRVGGGRDLERVLADLAGAPEVEWAEPNFYVHATVWPAPNDPHYRGTASPPQFYIPQIMADRAWNDGYIHAARGNPLVRVAVLDTGVDYTHPDFTTTSGGTRILTSPAGTGPPLGGGFIVGRDFVPPEDNDPMDEEGHGTMVAGFIGAAADNSIGIAGVAWEPRLMPVRVLDEYGSGTNAMIVKGLAFAKANGANVVNMSLGGPVYSAALDAAVRDLAAAGIVIIAASGNESAEVCYPAALPDAIAVGSVDDQDRYSSFSNFGDELALVAPGEGPVGLVSTRWTGGYDAGDGTSFATPLTAGVAALLLSQNPDWAPETVRRRLVSTTDKVAPPSPSVYDGDGFEPHMGYGRLNAYHALGGEDTTPTYHAGMYLEGSAAALTPASGPSPVARHRFATRAGGTAVIGVTIGDYSYVGWDYEVHIRNPDASVTVELLDYTAWLPTWEEVYSATLMIGSNDGYDDAVYVPEIVITEWSGSAKNRIPVPAITVPGVPVARLRAAASPQPAEAGRTADITVTAEDSSGNPISRVPVRGVVLSAPGAGAVLAPGSGTTGGTPAAFPAQLTLSSVPGAHLLIFTVTAGGSAGVWTSLTVTGVPRVALGVSSDPGGAVCAGRPVRYTIAWTKAGTTTAANLTVTDTLPNGTAFEAGSVRIVAYPDGLGTPSVTASAWAPSSTGPWTPGEPYDGAVPPVVMRWVVDRAAPGHSGWISYRVRLSATLSGGAVVSHGASATMSGDPVVWRAAPASLTIVYSGRLATVAAAPAHVTIGQTFAVTLTATNSGSGAVTLDPAIAIGPGAGLVNPVSGPSPAGPYVLNPGAARSFTWTFNAAAAGDVAFTASAGGAGCGGDTVPTRVETPAAIAASLAAIPDPATTGQLFLLTLTVTNQGGAALAGVTPATPLFAGPGGASVAAGPWPSTGQVAGGSRVVFTWTLTAGAAGMLAISTTATGVDANTGAVARAVAGCAMTIQPPGVLDASAVTAGPDPACRGDLISVTMTVTNPGGAAVADLTALPGPSVSGGGGVLLVSAPAAVPPLAGGAAVALTWTYSATGGGPVVFTVTVSGRDANAGTPMSAPGRTSDPVVVNAPGLLEAALSLPAGCSIGNWMTVALTVTNSGATDVAGMMPDLGLVPPGLFELVGGPVPAGPMTLTAGSSQTFAWTLSASGTGTVAVAGGAAGSDPGTGCPVHAGGSGFAASGPPAALVARLCALPAPVAVGASFSTVLRVTNAGASPAENVLPAIQVDAGAGLATPVSGPVPPGPVTLGPGASASFTWTWNAAGQGIVAFTATAVGVEPYSGLPVAGTASWGIAVFGPPPASAPCAVGEAWVASYDSPAHSLDKAQAVAVDGNGNVIAAGSETRFDLGQSTNWLIRKYGPAGGLLWSQSYNDPSNMMDWAYGVAVDAQGNVVVAGSDYALGNRLVVRKYDEAGALVWSRTYSPSGSTSAEAQAVAVDGAGNVVVAGYENRWDLNENDNLLVRKYGPAGNLLWSRTYHSGGTNDEEAGGVATDAAGNVLVAGLEYRWDLGEGYNLLVRKYDPDGNLLWSRTYNSPDNDDEEARAVAADPAGNVLVAGYEYRWDTGYDLLVRKYDPDGNLVWHRTYDDAGNTETAHAVAVHPDGRIATAGRQYRYDLATGYDWLIVEYDASGALLNHSRYTSPGAMADEATGAAFGLDGSLVVAGWEYRAPNAENWRVAKYDNRFACLAASLASDPRRPAVGALFDIVLTVTNTGSVPATGVTPALSLTTTIVGAILVGGPSPAGPLTLPPGGTASFTWSWSMTGSAPLLFSATAAGFDSLSGYPVLAPAVGGTGMANVLIYGPGDSIRYHEVPGVFCTVWDEATWMSKTTADFLAFDAVVIDGNGAGDEHLWDTAVANRDVWGPAITGNIIIVGSDPEEHAPSNPSPRKLIQQSVLFAADDGNPGPGLYVELHDYMPYPAKNTELLKYFGDFMQEEATCGDKVHKMAYHPVLESIGDAELSNWSCTPHSGFYSWPPSFFPLAMDISAGAKKITKACDGTIGFVCIVATGVKPLCGAPDIHKTVDPVGKVKDGNLLTYTLAWKNVGLDTLVSLTIVDTLPANSRYAAPSLAWWCQDDSAGTPVISTIEHAPSLAGPWTGGEPADGTPPPRILRWVVNRVAADKSGFLRFSARVSTTIMVGATVANQATFTVPSAGMSFSTERVVNRIGGVSIALTKTPTAWVVRKDSLLTYEIAYSNCGHETVFGITLWDTLPAGSAFAGCGGDGSCAFDGTKVVWSLPDMIPGATGSVVFTVSVTGGWSVLGPNRAVFGCLDEDLVSQPPSFSNPVTVVVVAPKITVAKYASAEEIPDGGLLEYTIIVTNGGTDTARNVTLMDSLPPGAVFIGCSGGTGCAPAGAGVLFTLPDLLPGRAATLTLTVSVAGDLSGTVLGPNRARTWFANGDANSQPAVDSGPVSVIVHPGALSVTKLADPSPFVPAGAQVAWTIGWTNTDAGITRGLAITDTLPAGVAYASPSLSWWAQSDWAGGPALAGAWATAAAGPWTAGEPSDGTPGPLLLRWVVDRVYPDRSGVLRFATRVSATLAAGDTVTNTAGATGYFGTGPSAADAVVVVVAPRLTVTKFAGADEIPDGGKLEYTFVVRNEGTDQARNVTIWDTLPPGALYLGCSGGTSCAPAGAGVSFSLPDLAPGEWVTLALSVSVSGDVSGASLGPNRARAHCVNGAGVSQPPADSGAVSVIVRPGALSATKLADPSFVAAGGQVAWTIGWTNTDAGITRGLTVTDTLPAGVAYVAPSLAWWAQPDWAGGPSLAGAWATAAAGPWTAGEPSDGTPGPLLLRWVVDRVYPDRSGFLRFATRVSATLAAGDTVANTAGATGYLGTGPSVGDASVTVRQAGLSLSKWTSRPVVPAGGLLTYTLGWSNPGTDPATGVTLLDTLPAGCTYVSCNGGTGCGFDGTRVSWTLGNVAPAATGSVSCTVRIDATGPVTNSAGGWYANSAGVPRPPVTAAPVTIQGVQASLALDNRPSRTMTGRCSLLDYTIGVTNTGTDTATGIAVWDTVPAGAAYAGCAGGLTCGPASPVVVFTLSPLGPGRSASVVFTVSVTGTSVGSDRAAGSYANSAGVARPDVLSNVVSVVIGAPQVSVTVWASPAIAGPGDSIGFTVRVRNDGTDLAREISVWDSLPAGAAFVSASGGGVVTGSVVTWTRSVLGPGDSGQYVLTLQPGFSCAVTDLAFGATLGSADNCLVVAPRGAAARAHVSVLSLAVTLTKSVTPSAALPGRPVAYRLLWENACTDTLWNARIWDTLPAGVNYTGCDGGASCGLAGGLVVWDLPPIVPGTSGTATVFATIDPGVTGARLPPNRGMLGGRTSLGLGISPVASNTVTVDLVGPQLVVTKEGPVSAPVEGPVVFRIDVRNAGTDTAFGVTVQDIVPAPLAYVSADPPPTSPGPPVRWTLGDLGPGEVRAVTVTLAGPRYGQSAVVVNRAVASYTDSALQPMADAAGEAAVQLESVFLVYPNPFDPSRAVRGTVKFLNAPVGARVRLYTTRGLRVWEGGPSTGFLIEWNGRNDHGTLVAPGLYLWVAEQGKWRRRGTLVVD